MVQDEERVTHECWVKFCKLKENEGLKINILL